MSLKFWTIKKISFISMLTATSVSFVLVFTTYLPIAVFPSVAHSIGGLPVKLTGFIFGPWIGGLTGIVSYLLSFILRPVVFHYSYMLAWFVTGLIPGCITWVFRRSWRKKNAQFVDSLETKISGVNFFLTVLMILLAMGTFATFIYLIPDDMFQSLQSFLDRIDYIVLFCSGFVVLLVFIIGARFKMKPKNFNITLGIVAFSTVLELFCIPLLALGDTQSFLGGASNESYLYVLMVEFLSSPVRIVSNLFIISFAYKVVAPLILKKVNNGY